MAGATIIETRQLTKRYGELVAVDHLDLEIREGEVFGLLGPNGAGKTTTILMLLGLTEPTSGEARIAGFDPTRDPLGVKRIVGYLPDNVGFYDELTGRQNLLYTARLNGIPDEVAGPRADELLRQVGLEEASDKPAGSYSHGMRQRLGLADVLIKEPRVIILDEPTLGIDPEGVREVLAFIRGLSQERGLTILLSSHLLHQVQQICDRVGIFVRGRLIACGAVDELGRQIRGDEPLTVELEADPLEEPLLSALQALPAVRGVHVEGPRAELLCTDDARAEVARLVLERGARLLRLTMRGFTLDDIYQRYFRGESDDAGRDRVGASR